MKNWTETEMPDFMSVAFSSERSIEDELERESEAEIITVVISYVVMFVYIAVALGQFRSFQTLLVSNPVQSERTTIVLWYHFRGCDLYLYSKDISKLSETSYRFIILDLGDVLEHFSFRPPAVRDHRSSPNMTRLITARQ
jgi:hypothetical protein